MYKIGEHIMYENIGVCVVEAVGTLCFSQKKEQEYYTLRPLYTNNNSLFYIPVNNENAFIRKTITRQDAYHYLTDLKNMHPKPFSSSKSAQLTAHYDEMMANHAMTEHRKLFKELCQKEKTTIEKGKRLGYLESTYKHRVETLLISEFSYALDESPDSTKKRLYQASYML